MKDTNNPQSKEPYSSPEAGVLEWNNLYSYLQAPSAGDFNEQDLYYDDWN